MLPNGLPDAVVGAPVIAPVDAVRLNPAGSDALPVASDHVYGAVPPRAVRLKENGSPTSPPALAPEVTMRLLISSVKACGAEVCVPTVTATLKL